MALRVRFNDYVYQQGDRLEKPNKTSLQLNSTDNEVGTTIRYTRQVQAVQELAKEFIVFSELLQEMSKRNPDVPLEVIEAFLNQLLENEFLLSELRPPMVNTDALTYVLNILAHIEGSGEAEDYRNHLATIQSDPQHCGNKLFQLLFQPRRQYIAICIGSQIDLEAVVRFM